MHQVCILPWLVTVAYQIVVKKREGNKVEAEVEAENNPQGEMKS